ncbi:hypothetical protein [Flavobacterium cerinum]|uniref:Uncharacterized protein n=1 Tax=Flavobacterium cerinum TaxID=2502784 RepID=A0A3S3S7P9_9FLAO|nr:hypothetical protein [Flavobacterium cerinum]RWW92191.1 hypothetical protein EPI11_16330 [Flavobacterium cerinum]
MRKAMLLFVLIFSQIALAQAKDGWEEWQKTSCYSKIFYRIKSEKKHGEQYHWKIQFRSNYPQLISFNYNITDKLQQYNITTHRKTLEARKQSEEIDVYTKEDDIFLLVDKVSLSPYPENFQECE